MADEAGEDDHGEHVWNDLNVFDADIRDHALHLNRYCFREPKNTHASIVWGRLSPLRRVSRASKYLQARGRPVRVPFSLQGPSD